MDTATDEEMALGVRCADGPEGLRAGMAEAKRRWRGAQRTPTKVMVTLRLDREALAGYRATGRGWQTRMSETISRAAKRLPPANGRNRD
jgi:uncharacterized protein (DUF4415 family)